MASSTDVRPKITLACEVCKHRNYITKKNRRNDPDRLEVKKHCPRCNAHTAHREMLVSMEGGYQGLGAPVKLSRTPASYRLAPLSEGQDFLPG